MDSVRNAASQAIYGSDTQGESGREPISGTTGRGEGAPYDAGNTQGDSTLGGSSGPNADSSSYTNGGDSNTRGDKYNDSSNTGFSRGGEDDSSSYDRTSGAGAGGAPDTTGGLSGRDTGATDGGSSDEIIGGGGVNPSSTGQQPFQKQQGADRPNEEPSGENTDAILEKKEATEESSSSSDPNNVGGKSDNSGESSEGKESKSEGTGTKWVKSTGLAADGGDFDATKPGAGREADRILDEKGVHREGPPKGGALGDGDTFDKPGIGDKIKEKLHRGGH
ncbi:MAG: hypothetical protein M1825_003446 [Sarcosagium campestre]|nr:MAG: hypothetical protein M1825_003446 [Sarcosagium campestre]